MATKIPNQALSGKNTIVGSLTASASEIGARNDEDCNPRPLDIEVLRQLISDNSFDLAIELLGKGGHEVFDIENGDGYQLLSIAVKVIPSSNAVLLVEALINAGVSIYVLDYTEWSKRNDLFFACKIGVDPIIFDALLKWDIERNARHVKWWREFRNFYNTTNGSNEGILHIACRSGHYDLVEHLMHTISKEESVRRVLDGNANNIAQILGNTILFQSEDYNIKLICLCRRFFDNFPVGYSHCYSLSHYMDHSDYCEAVYSLKEVIGHALTNSKYAFVLEFTKLFPSRKVNQIIWKWKIWSANVLPSSLRLRALSYHPSHDENQAERAKAKKANFDPDSFCRYLDLEKL